MLYLENTDLDLSRSMNKVPAGGATDADVLRGYKTDKRCIS